jgi:1,4-dihydroxy-2-naphthoate octaprenyltransferase
MSLDNFGEASKRRRPTYRSHSGLVKRERNPVAWLTLKLHPVRVFLDLSKFKIVDLWIGGFIAVSLLPLHSLTTGHGPITFVFVLVTLMLVAGLTCALDDIVGMRDGVDQVNHGEARFGVSKPLLDGRLSERGAERFSFGLTLAVLVCAAGAVFFAPPLPAWLKGLGVFVCLTGVSYSWGLKLSYRGAGELAVFVGVAGTVVLPYGFVRGQVPPLVWANAFLIGLWLAQVVLFSNTKDAAGDRATGRMTMAARLSPRGNRIFIAFVYAWGLVLGVRALLAASAPWWYLAATVPVWLAQARQLQVGVVRQQWLKARHMGFWIFRLGFLILLVSNFVLGQA